MVWIDKNRINILTNDNENRSLPLEVSPVLLFASPEEREHFMIWDDDQSIRWESLDVDIHISHFFENLNPNYDNEVNKMLSLFKWLDLKHFAESIGLNWEKLIYYMTGMRTPSDEIIERIRKGLRKVRQEAVMTSI